MTAILRVLCTLLAASCMEGNSVSRCLLLFAASSISLGKRRRGERGLGTRNGRQGGQGNVETYWQLQCDAAGCHGMWFDRLNLFLARAIAPFHFTAFLSQFRCHFGYLFAGVAAFSNCTCNLHTHTQTYTHTERHIHTNILASIHSSYAEIARSKYLCNARHGLQFRPLPTAALPPPPFPSLSLLSLSHAAAVLTLCR